MSPFEYAVSGGFNTSRLGQVREMAKWMETIPAGNYTTDVQREIDEGQKERQTFIGERRGGGAMNECTNKDLSE